MLYSLRFHAARHHAIRAFVMLLALGCAVVGDGQNRAAAQVPPGLAAFLSNPKECWAFTFALGPGQTKAWPGPDLLRYLNDNTTFSNLKESQISIGQNGDSFEIFVRRARYEWERVPCRIEGTAVSSEPGKLYNVGVGPKPVLFDPAPKERAYIDWAGFTVGFEFSKYDARVRTTERSTATGLITFQSIDSNDPLGVGIVVGYNFAPWNNDIVVGPFASVDWLKQTINHTFPGGTFLGTTTHWIITAGAKGGFVVIPDLYLYGLAGAAWLNQDLNVNFATAASSNVTTPGLTLGLGGEYQPSWWQLFGKPVSVFAQYQHTWWTTANFNTPRSSPGFNYAFKRTDDAIKLGVNVYFSAPMPPPPRAIISK